jgi:deoxyribodipyrimidine photo-lyase
VSGFIPEGDTTKSPYKEARSEVGGFWRCARHRAKFIAEAVWDFKKSLQKLGSDLCIRVGSTEDVIRELLLQLNGKSGLKVGAIWMVGEEGVEEGIEERGVQEACLKAGVSFGLLADEKYLIDE